MRCVHCHKFFSGAYCPTCWNNLLFGAPLKTNNIMIEDAVESIMEVLEDETRDLSFTDRMAVINEVRERIDALIEAVIIDE